jgi:hypothetical protein
MLTLLLRLMMGLTKKGRRRIEEGGAAFST